MAGNRWLSVWKTAILKAFQKPFILSWADGNMITWLESRLFPSLISRTAAEDNFSAVVPGSWWRGHRACRHQMPERVVNCTGLGDIQRKVSPALGIIFYFSFTQPVLPPLPFHSSLLCLPLLLPLYSSILHFLWQRMH